MKTKFLFLCPLIGFGLVFMLASIITPGIQARAHPIATWPQIDLIEVAGGLQKPVHLTHAGDSSGRLFVVEQCGRIRIIENGSVSATFLDITSRVRSPCSGGGIEEGLLSLAFPPGYGAAGVDHFYVYYTRLDGDNQVSRFRLGSNPDSADPASEKNILQFDHLYHENHNGGQLMFGLDGYLYIGTGDGGGGGDPEDNAQNPNSLLGKLLRIDVEGSASPPPSGEHLISLPLIIKHGNAPPGNGSYLIPADNPFVGIPGFRGEIWALGLRNPWRFAFDRQTGDLLIGDVGQGTWEEVDFQPASSPGGENYGWDIMEGEDCFGGGGCDTSGLTLPVFVYRTDVDGCAVTGGFIYRGTANPGMQGVYFLGDYCSGRIWGLQRDGNDWISLELEDTTFNISTFGEDQAGELFLANLTGGSIYKIVEK